jgi:hypothetical protein
MSQPPPPTDTLQITPWVDPVVDERGYPADSLYVDLFWLPVIGPSATVLFRRLNLHMRMLGDVESRELGFEVLSGSLGLGRGVNRNAPLPRAIDRCIRFGLGKRTGPDSLAVRRFVSPISAHHLSGLPHVLQELHAIYLDESTAHSQRSLDRV